jgi:hypothetical protein
LVGVAIADVLSGRATGLPDLLRAVGWTGRLTTVVTVPDPGLADDTRPAPRNQCASQLDMGRVLADFDDRSRRWQGALSPTRRSVPSSADLGARAIARRPA